MIRLTALLLIGCVVSFVLGMTTMVWIGQAGLVRPSDAGAPVAEVVAPGRTAPLPVPTAPVLAPPVKTNSATTRPPTPPISDKSTAAVPPASAAAPHSTSAPATPTPSSSRDQTNGSSAPANAASAAPSELQAAPPQVAPALSAAVAASAVLAANAAAPQLTLDAAPTAAPQPTPPVGPNAAAAKAVHPPRHGEFVLQFGAFVAEENAKRMQAHLRAGGYAAEMVPLIGNSRSMVLVRVGGFASREAAAEAASIIRRRTGIGALVMRIM